jgi:anaerobic C4-dicarboxylate transporter
MKDEHLKILYSQRDQYHTSMREESKLFDTYLLALSSSFLGLSIALIKQISFSKSYHTTYWIILFSWILFLLTMLIVLCSFVTSQKACMRYIKIIDDLILKDDRNGKNRLNEAKNKYNNQTNILNYLAIFFFIGAIIFLVIFTLYNIKSETLEELIMREQKINTNIQNEKIKPS